MNKALLSLTALLVLVIAFISINVLGSAALSKTRLDLTQGKLYTLSEGALKIAREIDEPISVSFYFSQQNAVDQPEMLALGKRIREVLEEFQRASAGKIKLKIVLPEPYSEEEQQAADAGLDPIPVSNKGDVVFLGLVGTNSTDGKSTISRFEVGGERNLEYDIAKMIYTLRSTEKEKKKLGFLGSAGLDAYTMNPQTGQPMPKSLWYVFIELQKAFRTQTLAKDAAEIPDDIDVLVISHPKALPDKTLYAIDQYLMRGGRVLAFVDPLCATDESINARDQMQAMMADRSSSLNKILGAYGVEVPESMVILDSGFAVQNVMPENGRYVLVSLLQFLQLRGQAFSKEDEVSRGLEMVNAFFSGVIKRKSDFKGVPAEITPLLSTSRNSMLIDKSKVQFLQDPKQLLTLFESQDESNPIAARLTGKVKSAFPDGPPKNQDGSPAGPAEKHLAEAKAPINMILVADADMLNDRAWVRGNEMGRQKQVEAVASNGQFVVDAVSNLSGSSDLLSIRPRAQLSRPFSKVEEIRKQAEKSFASRQKEAEAKVATATQKLVELVRKKEPKPDGTIEFTPELEEQIKKVQQEEYEAKAELRKVLRERDKEIEKLGRSVKIVNIAIIPALVALLAVGVGAYRANRKSAVKRAS